MYIVDPELRKYIKSLFVTTKLELTQTQIKEDTETIPIVSPYAGEVTSVPLFDSIGCGELMLADSVSDETVDVPASLIKPGAKYFALRTRGDSMNELGINEGDIILCQKNFQAPSGSNAIVLIGDEATLKQIKIENDGLVLIPKSTNSEHKVRKLTEDDEEFKVLGVFVTKL